MVLDPRFKLDQLSVGDQMSFRLLLETEATLIAKSKTITNTQMPPAVADLSTWAS